jgi:hypothetical protein
VQLGGDLADRQKSLCAHTRHGTKDSTTLDDVSRRVAKSMVESGCKGGGV